VPHGAASARSTAVSAEALSAEALSAEPRPETPPPAGAAAETGEFLRVDQVVKNFAVTSGAVMQRRIGQVSAVADVSFALPHGSTFGLVGESGAAVRRRRTAAAPLHQFRPAGRLPLPAPRAGFGPGAGGRIGCALTSGRGRAGSYRQAQFQPAGILRQKRHLFPALLRLAGA
jgi:hypothetical protein